jgi:hypothetical protein
VKRYMVFAHQEYDAGGGMRDFQGDFDDLQDAINFVIKIAKKDADEAKTSIWYSYMAHIYDIEDRHIVWDADEDYAP